MSEIADELVKLGNKALEHQTFSERGMLGDVTDDTINDIVEHLERSNLLYMEFEKACSHFGIAIPISEEIRSSPDYNSHLGLAILGHDLDGLQYVIKPSTYDAMESPEKAKQYIDTELLTWHDAIVLTLRLGSYVSSGNEKYDSDVNQDFEKILEGLMRSRIDSSFFHRKREDLTASDLFIVHQLYKNANDASIEALRNGEAFNEAFQTSAVLGSEGEYNTIVFKDNCFGISPEHLPNIFGAYTVGGTGIGLQITKRIVDLKYGHIQVISTQPGQETMMFDSRNGQVTAVKQAEKQGTTFNLYLNPKK